MSAPTEQPGFDDCWNRIGVRGDASCPELKKHVHCRNCPVYSAAATQLLDIGLPPDYLDRWTRHVAQDKQVIEAHTHSVIVFRVEAEWLALPTVVFSEIASLRRIHSIPHRRNGIVLGLANIRGELLACVSLEQILGLEQQGERRQERQRVIDERLLVLDYEGHRSVCPVDEVYGIQRFHGRMLAAAPATLAKAATPYIKSVLSWQDKSVGLLDEQLLFHTINRSLASATAT
ncbi:MAG TPA: chemotaxis protein CheW [Solimonas sp.]|nr:chemotaxis protein CheW [Solimonas sp.]